jgi:hypothetical protein
VSFVWYRHEQIYTLTQGEFMKTSRMRRIGAAFALALAAIIAVPAASQAVGYVPDSNIVSQPVANPAPGSTQTI